MIIYWGKAKGLTFKMLLWAVYFDLTRDIELLEAVDFSLN